MRSVPGLLRKYFLIAGDGRAGGEVPRADFILTPLPQGLGEVMASGVADNITHGWRAVGRGLKERPGGSVLVVGGVSPGSIGLHAAGLAVALQASRVPIADHDAGRPAIVKMTGRAARVPPVLHPPTPLVPQGPLVAPAPAAPAAAPRRRRAR
jgi:threonine dehydrogenase-like Zn-dependent dehydrogenase